jgi:hypothetical protein
VSDVPVWECWACPAAIKAGRAQSTINERRRMANPNAILDAFRGQE